MHGIDLCTQNNSTSKTYCIVLYYTINSDMQIIFGEIVFMHAPSITIEAKHLILFVCIAKKNV